MTSIYRPDHNSVLEREDATDYFVVLDSGADIVSESIRVLLLNSSQDSSFS